MIEYGIAAAATSVRIAAAAARELSVGGSDILFGLPGGGSNLDVIGAAEREGMRFVLAHSETAAAIMAGTYAELTNTPTACVVTRGPGAASVVNGVAQAYLDRQPLIVITDSVSIEEAARISHQRLDQAALFGPVSKWSGTLGFEQPGACVAAALRLAAGGRPGPVHLSLDPGAAGDRPPEPHGPDVKSLASMARARDLIAFSRRPVILLGVGAVAAAGPVRAWLNGCRAPILLTYKARGIVPDSWPSVAGTLTGGTRAAESGLLAQADLIVAVGVDAVELLPGPWVYPAPVVSLNRWAADSPFFEAQEELVGDLGRLLADLRFPAANWPAAYGAVVSAAVRKALRADDPALPDGVAAGPVYLAELVQELSPPDAIATVDAGAHMLAVMPTWKTCRPGELLISSGLATMGYALPAAVATALARPGRRVVCFVGDGGLGMVLAELETLCRYDLPVTVVVFDDASLSLIRVKQATGQGGASATDYGTIDFAGVATAAGLHAQRVTDPSDLRSALWRALECTGPSLVDVTVDRRRYRSVLEVLRGGAVHYPPAFTSA